MVEKEFNTGARRSADVERFRFDLISPIALSALAETMKEGEYKYDAFNWEKGMPVTDLLNHAIHHIMAFLAGDRDEPHLPHAAFNVFAAIHSHALWPEINDDLRDPGCRPPGKGEKGTSEAPTLHDLLNNLPGGWWTNRCQKQSEAETTVSAESHTESSTDHGSEKTPTETVRSLRDLDYLRHLSDKELNSILDRVMQVRITREQERDHFRFVSGPESPESGYSSR